MSRRPLVLVASIAAVGATLLGGCSDEPSGIGERTERVLKGGEFARQFAVTFGVELAFDNATCENPEEPNEGDLFRCSVTGSDGEVYDLTVRVGPQGSAEVIDMEPFPG